MALPIMAHLVLGYPTLPDSLRTAETYIAAGCAILELQIPFSHPTADGPVITAACREAVARGVTVADCLAAIRTLREQYPAQEMMVMSYLNRIFVYGMERFARDLADMDIRHVIVPDLPAPPPSYITTNLRPKGSPGVSTPPPPPPPKGRGARPHFTHPSQFGMPKVDREQAPLPFGGGDGGGVDTPGEPSSLKLMAMPPSPPPKGRGARPHFTHPSQFGMLKVDREQAPLPFGGGDGDGVDTPAEPFDLKLMAMPPSPPPKGRGARPHFTHPSQFGMPKVDREQAPLSFGGGDGGGVDTPGSPSRLKLTTMPFGGGAVPVIAANISDQRLDQLIAAGYDFFYLMSDFKITGSRFSLHPRVRDIAKRIKSNGNNTRVGIGFGIHTAAQVEAVLEVADYAIIGSALIRAQQEGNLKSYLENLAHSATPAP